MGHRCRFEARYSNEIHHFGCAYSKHLCAYKKVNDEWILTLKKPGKKETGIHEDFLAPQIDALREKGYLREDEGWLALHKGKWIKEKMIVKEIYERGLQKYDIPENFIWNGLP